MYDDLLNFVIYYALFNKKLFDNENVIINYFPKNVFGIFSTIRRFNTLKTYPKDIHGCIGYWDTNFNTLNKKTLYNELLNVSHDSVWRDERRKYFAPIQTDPNTLLELDFMMNPIYKINKTTGIIIKLNKPFTNNIYGIIIQTKDKKATYLPKVFPNISWKNIVSSIKNKANITTDDFELFAYKIIQIKTSINSILTGELFTYISIHNFSRLLLDNIKPSLPFPFIYSCKNDTFEWNSTDTVRNISVLCDIFKYCNLFPNIATTTELKVIKQKITYILENIERYDSQSLSFLGYIYDMYNINNQAYCKKLLNDLPFSEKEFERQEIIIGLNEAQCNIPNIKLTYTFDDSIFKMNWVIQAIISYNKVPSSNLIIIVERKILELLTNIKTIETNYLAVSFEALSFVYKATRKLSSLMFQLFFELEQRKNNTLYSFLDNSARVDITCHILNGLIH
jgi:AMMECR1 domain-containing protein